MSGKIIEFTGTVDQVKLVAANAINASKPVGLGYLHYQPKEYTINDVSLAESGIYIDYHEGRMVKLNLHRVSDSEWRVSSYVDPEYHSWASTYPSMQDLLQSAKVEIQ